MTKMARKIDPRKGPPVGLDLMPCAGLQRSSVAVLPPTTPPMSYDVVRDIAKMCGIELSAPPPPPLPEPPKRKKKR